MNLHVFFACGPMFRMDGFVTSGVLLLLYLPAAYYFFIQAFRFRVSRPIPMSAARAGGLTGLRALAEVLIVFFCLGMADSLHMSADYPWVWIALYALRLAAWWGIGQFGAGLRGRRLVGWTIWGALLNAAFDFLILAGLFIGWPMLLAPVIIFGCIAALHVVGRRDSLKARFSSEPLCRTCQYNLTGNLSGICPECGTRIDLGSLSRVEAATA